MQNCSLLSSVGIVIPRVNKTEFSVPFAECYLGAQCCLKTREFPFYKGRYYAKNGSKICSVLEMLMYFCSLSCLKKYADISLPTGAKWPYSFECHPDLLSSRLKCEICEYSSNVVCGWMTCLENHPNYMFKIYKRKREGRTGSIFLCDPTCFRNWIELKTMRIDLKRARGSH